LCFSFTAKKRSNTTASEDVDFRLDAHFDRLSVNLGTREQRLAEITVSGLKVDSTIQKSQMVFRTGLDGFRIANPKSGTKYRQIAAVEDTEALRVDVTIFNHATENEGYVDMDAVDIAVRLSAGRLKAVYISSFVQDLLSFVDHFQAAKAAVIEASSAAAQAAKQNVQRVYVQATRLKLDVQIKAPVIIVPQTSKASDALIIDLGQLVVNNQFELRSVRNEIGSPAIMDSIALRLKDLRLYLAVVDGMVVESERSLIDPLTFNLTLVRNLTATWYTSEPELSVDANLGKVDILLSEESYGKILKILIDNVQESQQNQRTTPENAVPFEEAVSSKEDEHISTPSSDLSAEAILQRYGPTRITLSFSITLAEIKMQLLGTEKTSKPSSQGRVPAVEKPLANLSLEGLKASGQLMSDDTLQCQVVLRSCLLEDSRPFLLSPTSPASPDGSQRIIKRPIHRLLYPSTSESSQNVLHSGSEMFTANFSRDKNHDSSARIHLCGFTLIVCPNYLLRLIHFFVCAPCDDLSHQPVNKPVVAKPVATQHVTTAVKKLEQKAPLMTVSVIIDKPDIILIEHIDSLDTNALVLNMEIEVTVLQLPQALDVSGSLSKLHIFSCVFDPARRRATMAEVLSPCSVAIKAKMLDDDDDSQAQVDVSISDVTLSVSPGTCEMLANISKSIVTDGVVPDSEEEPIIKVWSNLWDVKPLGALQLPFLEAEMAQEAFELNQMDEDDDSEMKIKREQMIVVLSHFTVILETGTGNRTSPLVLLESQVSLQVNNWSTVLDAKALLNLQAAYYNSLLSLWEPLLEPVDITRNGTSKQRPWEMTMTVKARKQEIESGCSSVTEIAFESSDTMELTVSRTFLDVVSMLSEAFSQALKQQLSKKVPAAHYIIRNDLDTDVVLDLAKSPFVIQDRESRSLTEVVSNDFLSSDSDSLSNVRFCSYALRINEF
jgi:vacuolar protein sorting-associated protein 13A/C